MPVDVAGALPRGEDATGRAAAGIRRKILLEGFNPGDRLGREQDLADEFGVSKPTMRETLQLLSANGLLRSSRGPGGGVFVARSPEDALAHSLSERLGSLLDLDAVSVADLLTVRLIVEPAIARLAAARIDAETIRELRELVEEARHTEPLEGTVADDRFHRVIAAASGNPVLQATIDWAFEVLQPRLYELVPSGPMHSALASQHGSIVDALAARDAAGVAQAVGAHIEYVRSALSESLEAAPNRPTGRGSGTSASEVEQVAKRLQNHIHFQRLRPGDRIGRQDELIELLGSSRTVLREALQMLSGMHIVSTQRGPGGGVFVTNSFDGGISRMLNDAVRGLLDAQILSVSQLLEARIALEVPLAGLAARTAGKQIVVALSRGLDEDSAASDHHAVSAGGARFHRQIADLGANRLIGSITAWMFEVLEPEMERMHGDRRNDRLIVAQHREVLDAIARRDPSGAEEAMTKHLIFLARLAKVEVTPS